MTGSTTTWTSPPSCGDVTTPRGVHPVTLTAGVSAWITGATIDGVVDANLAHHVAHRPERLAEARDAVAAATGTDVARWHLMRQVHGADVAVIAEDTPVGAEPRAVDVMVTTCSERPLVVLAADCLPILAAGHRAVGVAHAGWRGVVAGVPDALVTALEALGERAEDLHVALGPAIGPCCYAVGPEVVEAVAAVSDGVANAHTRSGAPSVDLRAAVRHRLRARGVGRTDDAPVIDAASGAAHCTACGAGWFSHRRDARAGRHAGMVVRRTPAPASEEP